MWSADQFICTNNTAIDSHSWFRSLNQVVESEETDSSIFKFPLKYVSPANEVIVRVSNKELKSNANWNNLMCPFTDQLFENAQISKNDIFEFTSNVLQQFSPIWKDDKISTTSFTIDCHTCSKSTEKLAKMHLKKDRMNLLLWNKYAQFEFDAGNVAQRIYITAISASTSFEDDSKTSAPLLYRMFAEMELKLRMKGRALAILIALAEDKVVDDILTVGEKEIPLPSATKILKARK
ncbi:hypothetical protein HK096_000762, partial [Nowakowskiella sp. JEL0078]